VPCAFSYLYLSSRSSAVGRHSRAGVAAFACGACFYHCGSVVLFFCFAAQNAAQLCYSYRHCCGGDIRAGRRSAPALCVSCEHNDGGFAAAAHYLTCSRCGISISHRYMPFASSSLPRTRLLRLALQTRANGVCFSPHASSTAAWPSRFSYLARLLCSTRLRLSAAGCSPSRIAWWRAFAWQAFRIRCGIFSVLGLWPSDCGRAVRHCCSGLNVHRNIASSLRVRRRKKAGDGENWAVWAGRTLNSCAAWRNVMINAAIATWRAARRLLPAALRGGFAHLHAPPARRKISAAACSLPSLPLLPRHPAALPSSSIRSSAWTGVCAVTGGRTKGVPGVAWRDAGLFACRCGHVNETARHRDRRGHWRVGGI